MATLAVIICIHSVLALIPSTVISKATINKNMIILSKKHSSRTYIIMRKYQRELLEEMFYHDR